MQSAMRQFSGVLLAVVVLGSSIGFAEEPSGTRDGEPSSLEFQVLGMTCEMCSRSATEALAEVPGVKQATVDLATEMGRVQTDGHVTPEDLRKGLGRLGFEALFPGETALEPLSEESKARLDIRTVSRGDAIRIKDHVAPGKVTVFDYYADWCGPCRLLSPKLERLVLRYGNVALRKVDLVNWESDAAQQATREFRLPGLPFTQVYDERGELLGQVHGNAIREIETLIAPHARVRQDPPE